MCGYPLATAYMLYMHTTYMPLATMYLYRSQHTMAEHVLGRDCPGCNDCRYATMGVMIVCTVIYCDFSARWFVRLLVLLTCDSDAGLIPAAPTGMLMLATHFAMFRFLGPPRLDENLGPCKFLRATTASLILCLQVSLVVLCTARLRAKSCRYIYLKGTKHSRLK